VTALEYRVLTKSPDLRSCDRNLDVISMFYEVADLMTTPELRACPERCYMDRCSSNPVEEIKG